MLHSELIADQYLLPSGMHPVLPRAYDLSRLAEGKDVLALLELDERKRGVERDADEGGGRTSVEVD